jgi:hypothetical protein
MGKETYHPDAAGVANVPGGLARLAAVGSGLALGVRGRGGRRGGDGGQGGNGSEEELHDDGEFASCQDWCL